MYGVPNHGSNNPETKETHPTTMTRDTARCPVPVLKDNALKDNRRLFPLTDSIALQTQIDRLESRQRGRVSIPKRGLEALVSNSCHKLRNAGRVFATTRETKIFAVQYA